MPVYLKIGDITREKVDCIVNAANNYLKHGGGVARAIANAAGPELTRECDAIGFVGTGDAVITTGGELPAKYVIHTAGPVYRPGNPEQEEQLASCIRSSLALAKKHKLQSIAFPAISTGIYGYPVDNAARIMLKTAMEEDNKEPMDIRFVLFSENDYKVFKEILDTFGS